MSFRIIVAGNESDDLRCLTEHLNQAGHTVTLVENADQLWRQFQESDPPVDLIIVHEELSKFDERAFLKRMQEQPSPTPLVLLTPQVDSEHIIRGFRRGVFDYLTAPIDKRHVDALLSRFQRWLQREPIERIGESVCELDDMIRMSFPSRISLSSAIIERIMRYFRPLLRVHQQRAAPLALCLSEAIMNAIVHGNLEIPGSLKEEDWDAYHQEVQKREQQLRYGGRRVSIEVAHRPGWLTVNVRDNGPGFEFGQLPKAEDPLTLLGGRGIILIRHHMDSVEWREGGRVIHMEMQLAPQS